MLIHSMIAVVSTDGGDTSPANDTATASTKVRRN